ncbi:C40 family peptidase [Ezakiella peruensis]|uniref:C40 family peptidase n=1 Tax=Ezakiella peruensis TaxID=1464038 RepID=UPI000C1B59F1|nr:C40 family peptidase [Ezakiella peruensis]
MNKFLKGTIKLVGAISILALSTFDTGTIINNVDVKTKDNLVINFVEGEEVEILKETPNGYVIQKDNQTAELDGENIIQFNKKSNEFTVRRLTALKDDKASDQVKRQLLEGESIIVQKNEGEYSFVLTTDNLTGYVLSSDLDKEVVSNVVTGELLGLIQLIDGTTLEVGTPVVINGFADGNFTASTKDKKEFIIAKQFVKIVKDRLSRAANRNPSLENDVVAIAQTKLNTPYVYATAGPNSFDCSGFSTWVYKQLGVKLPRSSASQSGFGQLVNRNDLVPGDLVFFNTSGSGVSHVGIYIGNDKFIHAASAPYMKVMINSLSEKYYNARYVCARRVL